ncbi:DUF2946 family protein [Methylosinus sp. Sm6]|uniref:DUF2946 family protein n=1 Tax=Methylosinus sp. Sm6 TaxID=2866948 RepID=UPI001C993EB7|nr:DUF2946 family protein [Methylosinus sp. Sm6]MBY6242568.1 hypothetical protein [Methylosinus sp. Sm6]
MRAIFAIVAACALVLSLCAAVAPHASARTGVRGAAQSIAVLCHESGAPLASADDAGAPDKSGSRKPISCPCCLAAHAGSAVLPERFALLMRLEPKASPAVYCSFPKSLPRFALRQTVNCARAPPAVSQLA